MAFACLIKRYFLMYSMCIRLRHLFCSVWYVKFKKYAKKLTFVFVDALLSSC
jgi:hypothetical protein